MARLAGFILASAAVLLTACASEEEVYVERPVEELYNEAMDALEGERYEAATRLFDEVERQHPYSAWATKAQLMAAFGYYQRNEYDEAIVALDRFIQLHPSNRDTPYAFYLKALCYYEQISDVERDQNMTESALKTLEELIARYPDSKYARDAKVKVDLTFDHLAGKTMQIGRYYLRRGHYLAAVNRFKSVVNDYQTTMHVPEALHRLVEAYLALGLEEEARKSAAVLGHNFPGSEWYIDSYELVELKRVRQPDSPWYAIWASSGETADIRAPEVNDDPWYKFW